MDNSRLSHSRLYVLSTLPAYYPHAPDSDGAARIGATLSGELLNAVFANIGQRAIRKVARETFEHLLNLDLRFHLSRQTGGLTRAIDRGTKGIAFLMQAILFRIVPTALEVSLVCGILVRFILSTSRAQIGLIEVLDV